MTTDIQPEDDDNEPFRFGDFTFAATAPNGHGDDDDWSDFVGFGNGGDPDAAGVINGVDSSSDPALVDQKLADSPVLWVKLGGAIPLSIFGEEEPDEAAEVEEGSCWDDPRATDGKDKVRDVKRVDVKDLIANLYDRDGNASPRSVPKMTELEFNADGGVGGGDVQIGGGVSGDDGEDGADGDDEWEFRAAPEGEAAEDANVDAKGVVQDGLDLTPRGTFTSWDALSFETNGHPMFNLFIPRLIMAKKDVKSLVELLNHATLALRLLRQAVLPFLGRSLQSG